MNTILRLSLIIFFLVNLWLNGQSQHNVKWDNGFKITSPDKNFKMKFGGRIMWDNVIFFQDDSLESNYGEFNNGTEFRRVRFFNSGTIYGNVGYKLNVDFANGGVSFKDVFVTLKKIPVVGNIRFGHFKEPIRFETQTSSKYFIFMERSYPINFLPERNSGVMIFNDFLDDKLSFQSGIFRRSDGAGNDKEAGAGFAFTSRLTGLAIANDSRSKLLHLGAGYSYRSPESESYKVSARPGTHIGPKYASTGTIDDVSDINIVALEASLVLNSFSLQSEYTQSTINTNSNAAYIFNSYYMQVAFFLTGEHRIYKNSIECFDRIKPKNNFGSENGFGAWEIAARYSAINLNSEVNSNSVLMGGQLSDLTIALNWYLNPAARIMFNYINAQVKDLGSSNIAQMRVQLDF